MKNLLLLVSLLAALLAVSGVVAAQDADPPSRVARIAYITGPVSFQPASVDQWADASPNYPMTTGDNLYTDSGARAVLRIGQNSIRLNSGTNFQIVNLSDNVVQTSVNSGSLSLHISMMANPGRLTLPTARSPSCARAITVSTPTRRATPQWSPSAQVISK